MSPRSTAYRARPAPRHPSPRLAAPRMNPLQILRATVADGVTQTIFYRADGYHVVVVGTDAAGHTVRREEVHARLERALMAVAAAGREGTDVCGGRGGGGG